MARTTSGESDSDWHSLTLRPLAHGAVLCADVWRVVVEHDLRVIPEQHEQQRKYRRAQDDARDERVTCDGPELVSSIRRGTLGTCSAVRRRPCLPDSSLRCGFKIDLWGLTLRVRTGSPQQSCRLLRIEPMLVKKIIWDKVFRASARVPSDLLRNLREAPPRCAPLMRNSPPPSTIVWLALLLSRVLLQRWGSPPREEKTSVIHRRRTRSRPSPWSTRCCAAGVI